jgi:tetratricopeptide (TPR) repeat protein
VSASAELRRGLDAFQAGDYAAATTTWRQARRTVREPESAARVDWALAEACFRLALQADSPNRAVRELEEASRLAPTKAIYRFQLGLNYYRLGQTRRAISAIEEAVRLEPGSERFRYHLALLVASTASGRSDVDAERARARQILDEIRTPDARHSRLAAILDLQLGDPTHAVAILSRLLDESVLARVGLGLAYLRWHEQDPAPDSLRHAQSILGEVQRAPDRLRRQLSPAAQVLATLGLAQTHFESGRVGEATLLLVVLKPTNLPDEPSVRAVYAALHRQAGRDPARSGQLADILVAVGLWRRAHVAQPGDRATSGGYAHLLEVAGMLSVRAGEVEKAAGYWKLALGIEPEDALRLRRNLAIVAERREAWEEAAERWEDLIRHWKRSGTGAKNSQQPKGVSSRVADTKDRQDDPARSLLAVAYRRLASAYEELEKPAEAAQALERALQGGATDTADELELRRRLTSLYRELENPTKAIEHLRRILAERPKDVRSLLDIGGAYGFKHDDRQALVYLEQARALEPENPAVHTALASAHHGYAHHFEDSKLFDRAVDEYKQAINFEPEEPSHWSDLGRIYIILNRSVEAEAAFSNVARLAPRDWDLQVEVGAAYLKAGDRLAAETHFRSALRMASRKAFAAATIAFSYLDEHDLAGAEPYLARVLKSRDRSSLLLAGRMLFHTKEYGAAVPQLERAISVGGLVADLVQAHLMLATVCAFGLGEHERAAAELASARQLAQKNGDEESVMLIEQLQETNSMMAEKHARTAAIRRRTLKA